MFEKSAKQHGDKDTTAAGDRVPAGSGSNPRPEATPRSQGAAKIGPSIHINGELSGEEDLVIEGTVEGTVRLDHNAVTIGEQGRVTADIHAKSITILGSQRGDLTADERVVIRAAAKVQGNIVAPRVALEDGAVFKGSIEMDPGAATKRSSPVKAQSTTASKPAATSEAKTAEA